MASGSSSSGNGRGVVYKSQRGDVCFLYSHRPVKMTTSSYPRQRYYGRGDNSNSYSSEESLGGFKVMIPFVHSMNRRMKKIC